MLRVDLLLYRSTGVRALWRDHLRTDTAVFLGGLGGRMEVLERTFAGACSDQTGKDLSGARKAETLGIAGCCRT